MGTRSQTAVFDGADKLVQIYRQFDGYPSGHGKDLAEFMKGLKLVNGMGMSDTQRIANGAGCFAAQLVAHLKKGPGHIYLEAPSQDLLQHDYTYVIGLDTFAPEKGIGIVVYAGDRQIFKGKVPAFAKFCAKDDEALEGPGTFALPL